MNNVDGLMAANTDIYIKGIPFVTTLPNIDQLIQATFGGNTQQDQAKPVFTTGPGRGMQSCTRVVPSTQSLTDNNGSS